MTPGPFLNGPAGVAARAKTTRPWAARVSASRTAPSMMAPRTLLVTMISPMRSPMRARLRSPWPLMTRMSPGWASSRARWMARLSPARVRIGRAVPMSRVALVNGRMPPSMTSSRSNTSPTLAAGAFGEAVEQVTVDARPGVGEGEAVGGGVDEHRVSSNSDGRVTRRRRSAAGGDGRECQAAGVCTVLRWLSGTEPASGLADAGDRGASDLAQGLLGLAGDVRGDDEVVQLGDRQRVVRQRVLHVDGLGFEHVERRTAQLTRAQGGDQALPRRPAHPARC